MVQTTKTEFTPPIQQPAIAYKPFSYPKYFEFFKQAVSTVWRVETVDMNSDIKDYLVRSNEHEREIIAGILRGFTILETHIGDYWGHRVSKMFPKHEIQAACAANCFFEAIHSQAYAHLNDSLGLDEYEAFLSDEVTRKKIEFYVEHPNDLVSLAVFSGAGEGVSLFGSFAALLSMSRDSRFKGLAQIISWSARDEQAHSEMGCMLFRDLVNEKGITSEEIQMIHEGFNQAIKNEFDFIDQIFSGRSLPNLEKEDLKDYMLIRANDRLNALFKDTDIEINYFNVKGNGYIVREWFENEVFGQGSNDFFWQSLDGGGYTALLSQNYAAYDYSKVSLEWKD